MDYVTRQFIVLAKKLRDDLRKSLASLGIDLHHIKEAIQSIDKHNTAQQSQQHPPQEVIAVMHEPEAAEQERRTHQKGTERRDRVRLWVETLTLLAVIFYGYMAVRQWREQISARHVSDKSLKAANDALQLTKDQFRSEERPWLIPDLTPAQPDKLPIMNEVDARGIPTGKVWFNIKVQISNVGKTPAVEVYMTHPKFIKAPTKQALSEAMHFVPIYQKSAGSFIGSNQPPVVPVTDSESNEIPAPNFEKVKTGDWSIFIVGAVRYTDIFKPSVPPYETTYCYHYRTVGLPWGECGFGLSVK